MELVIGTKRWSTWSLRPWLALKRTGAPFSETLIGLRQDEGRTEAAILPHSPSGLVPALKDGDLTVWDSLAICEYLAELAPTLWPANAAARAEARSISAEMHAGFGALRRSMPMEIHASKPHVVRSPEVLTEIARIVAIWEGCRARFADQGPFLFGQFTVADAMFAPVVWRFKTYAVELPPAACEWVKMMCELPAMQDWQAGALAEKAK